MKQLDLNNLSKDPALAANSHSQEMEREEDSPSLGKLRHLRALHQSQAFRDQSRKLLKQQSDTPRKMASRSEDRQGTPK